VITAVRRVGDVIRIVEFFSLDLQMTKADESSNLARSLQLALCQRGTLARDQNSILTQRELRGFGDDRAVDAAGEGDRTAAVLSNFRNKLLSLRYKFAANLSHW
jgi:hypothetical protein